MILWCLSVDEYIEGRVKVCHEIRLLILLLLLFLIYPFFVGFKRRSRKRNIDGVFFFFGYWFTLIGLDVTFMPYLLRRSTYYHSYKHAYVCLCVRLRVCVCVFMHL
ncbi:hypothetical protein, unlikely [Trypanosoma brucei gambiense DAL972]|uniref:Uncharacterized protein n=1 Tax=Trypanosoma brucei gambiense (strain MHOM/CI/86/DAL972) TaxID=679716 RepID=C9ZYP1_TRYB9|nr:hypothetical protein, unlikely [Trypanosoma brucei gambiense DAL972]CBH14540.1 hypothetical protein, unlikely [Trypanosoma brucei gambiense DAL972]|eukprot:XP_011776806.1 hypothetical protein, unlikely [Trypanosoma brucei gambiense DAL972]